MMNIWLEHYLREMSEAIQNTGLQQAEEFEKAVKMIKDTSKSSWRTIIVGNGGSAAIASHVAVDLTKTSNIMAINFNEADLITCFANDYGYEHWVEEALKAYACRNDLVILISSSGKSPNIVNAARLVKSIGFRLITFSGFEPDNPLRQLGDINFWVDSKQYNYVEMAHQAWLLAIVDRIAEDRK
jgi:D-sedoheptulose 7-phosphate isomerase